MMRKNHLTLSYLENYLVKLSCNMLVSVRTRWGCLVGAGRDEKNIQFQNWEHASSQQPMHLNI